jgi:nicotinate-nucleotide pyrophosphorylase (carboxylating)
LKDNPPALESFRQRISWDDLDKNLIEKQLKICVEEDLGQNSKDRAKWQSDITTRYCEITNNGSAYLTAREPMILCGTLIIPFIIKAFGTQQVTYTIKYNDGDAIQKDEIIGILTGPINEILAIERSVLNYLQRLSGISTAVLHFKKKIEKHGVGLLDTRKTTPGLRLLEKYASACGGSFNHRIGLFDRILIKDNHLAAAQATHGSGLENFLRSVVRKNNSNYVIEVEIDEIEQLEPAISSGVDAVLLDNFSPTLIKQAMMKNKNRVVIEASGGITDSSILDYAKAQPHFISTGSPIHSSRWVDIGLDWE